MLIVPFVLAAAAAQAMPDAKAAPPAEVPMIDSAVAITSSRPWGSFDEGYRCTIERVFGPNPGNVALKFGRTAFGSGDAEIILRGVPRLKAGDTLSLRFGDAPPILLKPELIEMPQLKVAVLYAQTVNRALWPALASATTLQLRYGKRELATIELGRTKAVIGAAEACAEKQFVALGATADQARRALAHDRVITDRDEFAAKPKTPLNRWISISDFPVAAQSATRGRILIVWQVSATGAIQNCKLLQSSGEQTVDAAGCAAVTRRGRYLRPALSRDGRPVASVGSLWVRWTPGPEYIVVPDRSISGFVTAPSLLGGPRY